MAKNESDSPADRSKAVTDTSGGAYRSRFHNTGHNNKKNKYRKNEP